MQELHDSAPERFAEVAADVGIKRRRAFYLLQVAETIWKLNQPDELIEKIGWTKINLIAPYLDQRDTAELLEWAQKKTAHELTAALREDAGPKRSRCILLRFTPEEWEAFTAAVVANGGKRSGRGLVRTEDAVMQIIAKLPRTKKLSRDSL